MSLDDLNHSPAPIMSSNPLPKTSGVYAITKYDIIVYTGSAINLRQRWKKHKADLRRNDPDDPHGNEHLQRSWNKYGESAFKCGVLEECPVDQLLIREQYYLDTLPDLYNICRIAGSRLGTTHTPEARERIRAARTGSKATDEAKANMSASKMGNTSRLGHKDTPEARANMSAARMGNTNLLGYVHTPESKARMSESKMGNTNNLGHKDSDEVRAKKSAARMGNQNRLGQSPSSETRERLRQANTGRKHTDEARANMSIAQKARFAREREAKQIAGQTPAVEVS